MARIESVEGKQRLSRALNKPSDFKLTVSNCLKGVTYRVKIDNERHTKKKTATRKIWEGTFSIEVTTPREIAIKVTCTRTDDTVGPPFIDGTEDATVTLTNESDPTETVPPVETTVDPV